MRNLGPHSRPTVSAFTQNLHFNQVPRCFMMFKVMTLEQHFLILPAQWHQWGDLKTVELPGSTPDQ